MLDSLIFLYWFPIYNFTDFYSNSCYLFSSAYFRFNFLFFFKFLIVETETIGASDKESACQCSRHKRHGFNPWVRKIHWKKKFQTAQYYCLENSMERGPWQATVHWATNSQTQLSMLLFLSNICIQCYEFLSKHCFFCITQILISNSVLWVSLKALLFLHHTDFNK